MSEKKFKFVSPGVEIAEIDNSQYDATPEDIGYLVIGRARRGPAMRPVTVNSYSEFIEIFGDPLPDSSTNTDIWREGVQVGPTYGVYAAQAALKNKSKLTYVRLLGTQHAEYTVGAGEAGWKAGSYSATNWSGGAFGLFVWPSGSNAGVPPAMTGTLAAIWYCTTGSINLSGSLAGNSSATRVEATGTAVLIDSNSSKEFVVDIKNRYNSTTERVRFNLTPSSDRFIRKVFNTNPSLTNNSIFTATSSYWLGETFEDFIRESDEVGHALSGASILHGAIFALGDGVNYSNNRQIPMTNAQTGWFFQQDLSANYQTYAYNNMTKLFKFHALDSGEWMQSHVKISITNIKQSQNDQFDQYGTFDVLIRAINDTDENILVLERFTNCNLNPGSENYIAEKIGDKYVVFNSTTRRNVEYGEFNNRSKFIRVEVSEPVMHQSMIKEALPFGVYGPIKYKNFVMASGSTSYFTSSVTPIIVGQAVPATYHPFIMGGTGTIDAYNPLLNPDQVLNPGGTDHITASVIFPTIRLRNNTLSGSLSSPKSAYFGVYTKDSVNSFAPSVKDLTRIMPAGVSVASPDNNTDYQWIFSLDDIRYYKQSGNQGYDAVWSSYDAEWVSGSHVSGTSLTVTGTTPEWTNILDAGFDSFTTVLFGGFDGVDITEVEPFRNTSLVGASEKSSYAYNSIKRAVDVVSDSEEVVFSDLFIPGLTEDTLTSYALQMCEERADSLCVMDLESDYIPRTENTDAESARIGSVSTAVSNMNDRGINSSYGAAYYPWVQMRDNISGNLIWVPPSVVAAGVFAKTDRDGGPWWAPAGLTRGGVSSGAAGIPIINVRQKLTKSQRDDLYNVGINPIASFPNQGIVVWGQKTLQSTKSALDRINVRRMILFIKRRLSQIALQTAFEFNDVLTWEKFKGKADIFLREIFADRGISEYKLVLDETTTTPDLIDRNIMYAKLYIKPTKVAEFIAIDLAVTNQGASFADF